MTDQTPEQRVDKVSTRAIEYVETEMARDLGPALARITELEAERDKISAALDSTIPGDGLRSDGTNYPQLTTLGRVNHLLMAYGNIGRKNVQLGAEVNKWRTAEGEAMLVVESQDLRLAKLKAEVERLRDYSRAGGQQLKSMREQRDKISKINEALFNKNTDLTDDNAELKEDAVEYRAGANRLTAENGTLNERLRNQARAVYLRGEGWVKIEEVKTLLEWYSWYNTLTPKHEVVKGILHRLTQEEGDGVCEHCDDTGKVFRYGTDWEWCSFCDNSPNE